MNNTLLWIALLLLAFVVLTGCDRPQGNPGGQRVETRSMTVWHDDQRNVTCYILGSGALDCIPDWQLTPPAPKAATKASEGFHL